MEPWTRIAVLAIGGSLGVNARYWFGAWITRWVSSHWATCVINVSGSFLIGFLAILLTRWLPHPNIRLLVITGFLGGYTTFSTFEYDAMTLWERGERWSMAANVVVSVVVGFAAVVLGTALGRGLVEPSILKPIAASSSTETTLADPIVGAPFRLDRSSSTSADEGRSR
jgi:CrcB protein